MALLDVYSCSKSECKDGVLTIHKPVLIGKVRDYDGWVELIALYNGIIVCPDLYSKGQVRIVVFKH